MACQSIAAVCQLSMATGTLNEEFFTELQDEVARELRLMETSEAESESLARRIGSLYKKLHPSDHLSTIPGVGPHTAPIFLSSVGDPTRFRNQSAFANFLAISHAAGEKTPILVLEAASRFKIAGCDVHPEEALLAKFCMFV